MKTPTPEFHFTHPKPGVINVFNHRSYLMAEYNRRSGLVAWKRIVLATQRAHIESWLLEHYPITKKVLN